MRAVLVPLLLTLSSVIMATAWLGHLKFRHWGFFSALLASWLLVLPEYMINVGAIRWGHGLYTGGQMATMNLATGVVAVAFVSRFVLGEPLSPRALTGFALMLVSVWLIVGEAQDPEPVTRIQGTEAGAEAPAPLAPQD